MKLSPLFYKLLNIFLVKLFIICCLVGIAFLLVYLLRSKKKDLYKYKITNFYLNWVLIYLYIGFFIFFIFYLRYTRLKSVDIKPIKLYLSDLYSNIGFINSIFLSIVIILIVFIFLIPISKIHKFFISQIIKRHVYYINVETKYKHPSFNNKYDAFLFNFSLIYSKTAFESYLLDFITCRLYKFLKKLNLCSSDQLRKILIFFYYKLKYYLNILPTFMLIILIIYDIYYLNWVIAKVFYYLIFYMIYNIWNRYSIFCKYHSTALTSMVYDMYYNTHKILYVNMPDEHEQFVYDYIDNGLQYYWDKDKDKDIDTSQLYLYTCQYNKYVSTDGLLYTNAEGLSFIQGDPRFDIKDTTNIKT
jgi:hypothetical protein